MFNAILVLARARFRIFRNTFWRGKLINKLGMLALLLVAAGGAWLVYTLMRGAVGLLTSEEFLAALAEAGRENPAASLPTDFRPYLAALPSIALFGTLALLIFTSFSTVLSSLYLSGDLDMLVVAPVPMRAVFVVKLFGGLLVPYVLLFVLLAPALLGYGQALGYGPAFFTAAVVILLLFPLLPVGVGALLVMVVVRLVPARRARDIVGVIGGLLGVAWYVVSQFSPQIAPRIANVETLEGLRRLDLPLLPSAWAGRALVAAGEREWLTLALYGGLFVVASVAVFGICLVLAERLYYVGWSNIATQGGTVRRPAADQRRRRSGTVWSALVGGLSSLLPSAAAAIVFKDLRVFPRDLRNLQQVIFPLALAGIWTFQLVSNRGGAEELDGGLGSAGGVLGSVGISFFVCMSLSNVLGGPSVSREGRGYWLLKAAPVRARTILLGKLALAYLPYPLAGTLLVALLTLLQRGTPLAFLSSLALVLVAGLGTSAIALGMGAAFPRFDWENPQQQNTLQAGCLAPVLYMTYVALAAGLALGLPALANALVPAATAWLTALGWALLLALTAGVVWAALGVGAARLEQVEIA
jgi:ABC-2 type transport system permease protein